jgi:hypothetical protein
MSVSCPPDCLCPRTEVLHSVYNSASALGGPLGGFFSDRLGWLGGLLYLHERITADLYLARRFAFLFQLPLLLFSALMVGWKVNIPIPSSKFPQDESLGRKLARIDWLGSTTLVIFVGALLTGVSLKTSEELPWGHPLVVTLLVTSILFAALFFLVEKYWAQEPVMPLRMLRQRNPLFVSLSNLYASVLSLSAVTKSHTICSFFLIVVYLLVFNVPLVSIPYFSVRLS